MLWQLLLLLMHGVGGHEADRLKIGGRLRVVVERGRISHSFAAIFDERQIIERGRRVYRIVSLTVGVQYDIVEYAVHCAQTRIHVNFYQIGKN